MLKGISAVNTPVVLNYDPRMINVNHLGFRANASNSIERNPQNDVYQKPKKKTGLLVTTGVLAVGAAAIALDYWKCQGKHTKGVWNGIKSFLSGDKVSKATSELSAPKVKIDDFKKNGKFVKGKALLNDGTAFSGKITNVKNDGTNIVMEYKDGIIQKSTKLNGENIVWQKNYKNFGNDFYRIFDKNGDIKFYKQTFSPGKVKTVSMGNVSMEHDIVNRRITKKGNLNYIYDEKGVLQSLKDGQYIDTIFYPDGKTVRCKRIGQYKNMYAFFDEKGQEIAIVNGYKDKFGVAYPQKGYSINYDSDFVRARKCPGDIEVQVRDFELENLENFKSERSFIYETKTYTKVDNVEPGRYRNASFYKYINGKRTRVDFDVDSTKKCYDITQGNCSAIFDRKTKQIKIEKGDWTEADVRKLVEEYKQKSKERILQTRQAIKDFSEYRAEIRKYGDMSI